MLGRSHPDALTSMSNLALFHSRLGESRLALSLFRECLDRRMAALGADHPHTLDVRGSLAAVYLDRGEADAALPLYLQCLEQRVTVLGEDHIDTLKSMYDLALFYNDQGDYELALPLYQQCLAKRTLVLGADHAATVRTRPEIAKLAPKPDPNKHFLDAPELLQISHNLAKLQITESADIAQITDQQQLVDMCVEELIWPRGAQGVFELHGIRGGIPGFYCFIQGYAGSPSLVPGISAMWFKSDHFTPAAAAHTPAPQTPRPMYQQHTRAQDGSMKESRQRAYVSKYDTSVI